MFKCQQCQSSGLRPRKIVVERKMVNHLEREKPREGQPHGPRGPRGGIGSQIVREVSVCDTCAAQFQEAPIEHNVVEKVSRTKIIVEDLSDAA